MDFRNLLAHANGNLMFKDSGTFEEKIDELKALFDTIHEASEQFIAEYIRQGIKKRGFSRPYAPEEIELDLDQLFVSQLMLTPRDCRGISNAYPEKTKLDTLTKNYLSTRASEVSL